jgi:hypothetical protein
MKRPHLLAIGVLAACGGNVVVDGSSGGSSSSSVASVPSASMRPARLEGISK